MPITTLNLATAFSKKAETLFTRESFFKGKTNSKHTFEGVSSVSVYSPQTVAEQAYTRSGANRFTGGSAPTEVADAVQTMTMSQNPAWGKSIDALNASEQGGKTTAGEYTKQQLSLIHI